MKLIRFKLMKNYTSTFLLIIFSLLVSVLTASVPAYTQDKAADKTVVFDKSFATMLPLTGTYSVLGEKASRGIATAAKLSERGQLYQMYVRDVSEFEPDILKIYSDLVQSSNISFVLGPLTSKSTHDISKVVDNHSIPTVTFPVFEDSAAANRNLVKFYYPIEDQVELLVDFAMKNLNVKKYAVLYPKTKFGKRFKEAFVKAAKMKGGEFLHVSSYSQDLTGIDVELQWIKPFNPEGIVIADNPSRASSIITKFAEDRNITDILFIGPNTWNTGYFAELMDKEVDGLIHKAIFTDYLNTESPEWKQFAEIYRTVFEEEPGPFEYQVYKVTKLLFELDNNGDNSKSLLDKIKDLGSSGDYTVEETKTGIVLYPKPHVLSLEGDSFKVVN